MAEEGSSAPGERGPGELDPRAANLVLVVGRKGSGKSVVARALYASYPYDKLAVDVNGDAEPGPDAEALRAGQLPARFPATEDGTPRNLHYRADPGSATYRDDLDRAIAMALFPQDRPCLVWLDEVGEVTSGNNTPPHLRRLLMQARHYQAAALMCGPRPVNIDPLCVSQADRIHIFALPNPKDRERLAENMGYPPARLAAELDVTRRRGPYWHLLYDAREHTMWRMPPMPVVPHRARPR